MNAPAAIPAARSTTVPMGAARKAPTPVGQAETSMAAAKPATIATPSARPAAAKAVPKPMPLTAAGLQEGTASRLAPQVRQFEDRYRDVQVVKQPTTSGWTWLFLAWALHNSSANNRLESDNAAMKARMSELERQLRNDPDEWQQLQQLATSEPADSAPAEGSASAAVAEALELSKQAAPPGVDAADSPAVHLLSAPPEPTNWLSLAAGAAALAALGIAWSYTLRPGRKT